jgi:hypothetical protein
MRVVQTKALFLDVRETPTAPFSPHISKVSRPWLSRWRRPASDHRSSDAGIARVTAPLPPTSSLPTAPARIRRDMALKRRLDSRGIDAERVPPSGPQRVSPHGVARPAGRDAALHERSFRRAMVCRNVPVARRCARLAATAHRNARPRRPPPTPCTPRSRVRAFGQRGGSSAWGHCTRWNATGCPDPAREVGAGVARQ